MANYGKEFEERFKQDWIRTFPNASIVRLYDVTSGYKSMKTICDYICYNYPYQFFIECKTHSGASLPIENITQYNDMIKEAGKIGQRVGILLWLYDKDVIYYVPIETIRKLKENNEKSVGIKAYKNGYRLIEIPSKKLRKYMQADLTCLMTLQDGD